MSFNGKVVIVTGAGSGIGASTSQKFSEEKALVVLVDKNENSLNENAKKCQDSFAIHADISKDDDVRRIITETVQKFNQIDVLVNCAGIAVTSTILDGDILKSYTANLNVNLRGPIHLTKLVTPYLIKTKGNIVNISSIAARMTSFPIPYSMYSISKAGLSTFTLYAASELASHNVRVNSISPGPVKTNIIKNCNLDLVQDELKATTALNRLAEPEEIADLVLFLASDKAKGITGSDIISDNGYILKNN